MRILLVSVILIMVTTLPIQGQSYGKYTLYIPKNATKAYLADLNGSTYHTWTFSSSKPNGYSAYLLPGGVLLRTVARQGNYFTGGPICGEVQKVDWNGNVIWDYVYSTTEYCTHHDICPMPNGNVLLIAYETRTPSQVSAAGCSQSITMWPDKIVEIEPVGTTGGNVVWEWHTWDHLCQSLYPAKDNYVTSVLDHPELININYQPQKDWQHVNGIDYNEQLDQIVFSSHNFNEIYVIDHSTTTAEAASHSGGNSGMGGDILYRWGNPQAYQAAGTANFNVVHDAHWVPQGCPRAGYLCGFNNKGGTGGKSCVDIFAPPYNGFNYYHTPGTAFEPATYAWRHTYSGSATQNEGNSQQLPNGNTLVNISFSGYIYEIDSNQNVIWSKTTAGSNSSAFRYTDCYVNSIGSANATASPSALCQGNAVQLNAVGIGGDNYVYSWTSTPTGFTSSIQNPQATPETSTTYIVTITSGSCSAIDSVRVEVVQAPEQPVITFHADSLISSSPENNQWYRDGNPINGATSWFYIPTLQGSYQVKVILSEGCESPLSNPYVFTAAVDESVTKETLRIFWNQELKALEMEGLETLYGSQEIFLFDIVGKVIYRNTASEQISLSHLIPGIYIARLVQDHKCLVTVKIIVPR